MKATGVVRRIDDLGRIVLPKELRRTMRIKEGESLEIYTDGIDQIVLKKYSPVQNMNDFIDEFVESLYFTNKKDIIVTDNEKVVTAAGSVKNLINKKISIQLQEKITKRNTQIIEKGEFFEICDNIELKKAYIIKPINVYGDILGSIIVCSDTSIGELEKSIVEFSGLFMSRYLEGWKSTSNTCTFFDKKSKKVYNL